MFVLIIRPQDVFRTFSRHLQDVFKRYHRVKLFLLTRPQDVFNKFLRCIMEKIIHKKIYICHTSKKFVVRVQIFQVNSLDITNFLKQFFKTLYEVTASTNKDILVKVGLSPSKKIFLFASMITLRK